MDDTQFKVLIGVIAAGLGAIATAIKWSVGVLTKSLDGNTVAHLRSVEAMTQMSTKLDFVYLQTGKVGDFIKEEISGVHDTPLEKQNPKNKRPRSSPNSDED